MQYPEYAERLRQARTGDFTGIYGSGSNIVLERIPAAQQEQADMAFMQSSTASGIMLTGAMRKLTNLQAIIICPISTNPLRRSIREAESSSRPTTTHVFSMVLSSLALSGARVHTLQSEYSTYGSNFQGVSLQALSMPPKMFRGIHRLRKLELALETNDTAYQSQYTIRAMRCTHNSGR
jgi:hypothetical protein